MSETTLKDLTSIIQSDQENLTELEESGDFTLVEHHKERIEFHLKMLEYYFNEK